MIDRPDSISLALAMIAILGIGSRPSARSAQQNWFEGGKVAAQRQSTIGLTQHVFGLFSMKQQTEKNQ